MINYDKDNTKGIYGVIEDLPDYKKDPRSSLSELTVKGVSWQLLSAFIQISLSLLIGIILARLLTPTDFGIVGYILVFIGFSKTITEGGISPAYIQLPYLTKGHLGVGLIISFSISLLMFGVLWFLSPVLVHGNSIIALRILSLIFFINCPAIISESLLRRNLKFFPIFIADSVSYFIGYGLVSISLAFFHYGVWSLIIGILVQSLLRSTLMIFISPYKITLKFSKTELGSVVRFGSGMTLTRISNYSANNLDYFVTGTFLGSQGLGLYQRSFQLITTSLLTITGVLTSVLFPAFSRIQNDLERIRHTYLLAVTTTSLIVFPIAILISLISRELIIFLYGSKWIGSVTSLSILSINALLISILTLGDALSRAKGLVYHQFRRHFVYAVLVFTFAFIGKKWNIEGVAIGVTLATFCMYLIMAQLSIKITKASWRDFFTAQVPGFFIASIMGIITYGLGQIAGIFIRSTLLLLTFKVILAGIIIIMVILFIPKSWLGDVPVYLIRYLNDKYPRISMVIRAIFKINRVEVNV